jgi:putative copper resistance protein D
VNAAIVIIRAVYFGAVLQSFGLSVFGCVIVPLERRRWAARVAAMALVAMVAWLPVETMMMSGAPLSPATLGTVLRDTQFGTLWLWRAVALVVVLVLLARWPGRIARIAAAFAAGAILVLTAAAGHAGASGNPVQLATDAVHLLAAGAWLGGLVPLAVAMRRPDAGRVAWRFSTLGTVCVCLVLVTGGANAWFLVGKVSALTGTPYGRLLLVKLIFVALLLMMAATNRFVLTPGGAVAALRRNALIETALGAIIVAIVAVLGTMVPGYYQGGN